MTDDDLFDVECQFRSARIEIRKSTKTTYDRLRSIQVDARFVDRVVKTLDLPALCNERCGRWYVPPQHLSGSVYFKSTDGHTDHCKFSLRRLNTSLLGHISAHSGVVLVDATRRGKTIPDALSKTVPIWCCVMNRATHKLYQHANWTDGDLELFLPRSVVSRNEHARILTQIDAWVEDLLRTGIQHSLFACLRKPLRPMWLTPASHITPLITPDESTFYPVVCVSASKAVHDGIERCEGFTYFQGAADDEEMWAGKLTPSLFWTHHEEILQDAERCEDTIESIVRLNAGQQLDVVPTTDTGGGSGLCKVNGTELYLTNRDPCRSTLSDTDALFDFRFGPASVDVHAGSITDADCKDQETPIMSWYHFPLEQSKRAAPHLLRLLPKLDTILASIMSRSHHLGDRTGTHTNTCTNDDVSDCTDCRPSRYPKIIIVDSDKGFSHGCIVALLILCLYYPTPPSSSSSLPPSPSRPSSSSSSLTVSDVAHGTERKGTMEPTDSRNVTDSRAPMDRTDASPRHLFRDSDRHAGIESQTGSQDNHNHTMEEKRKSRDGVRVRVRVTKDVVRRALVRLVTASSSSSSSSSPISSSWPIINPRRADLKVLNTHLMS